MAKQNRSWDFDLEEGLLDSSKLPRIIIDPYNSLSFKKEKDLVGYYELISHTEQNEIEIAYLGILEEYQNQNKPFSIMASFKIEGLSVINPSTPNSINSNI